MTCERHGGNAGSIMCRECDLETIERDAMTTPTPSDYWINECIKIAASAGNLDAAENARRDLAAAREAPASKEAELASVKAHAEAMAKDLEDWISHGRYNDCTTAESQAILDAYRAAHPKDAT